MNIIDNWLKTYGSNKIAKFVEQEALDRLINETNRLEAENVKLKLLHSSLHVKEKSTPTFEDWLIDNKYVITKATYITQYGHLVSREFLWHKYIEESQL